MAESLRHKGLVLRIVAAVSEALKDCDDAVFFIDGILNSEGAPQKIGGFRPDVYATGASIVVIGEAKPTWDVESPRTRRQLQAFLEHVEAHPSRHLVFAVHWTNSATAKSVLRDVASNWTTVRKRVHILDGVSGVMIRENGESCASST